MASWSDGTSKQRQESPRSCAASAEFQMQRVTNFDNVIAVGNAPEDNFSLIDTRIEKMQALICPQLLREEIPVTEKSRATVMSARKEVTNILHGLDDRLLVIVGPCSIHDPHAALEYARKLKGESVRLSANMKILMRVYFEKPAADWKGLINDPDLDGTFQINKGLRIGRRLLADITQLGVPVACEYLDTITPQYLADLVSWGAIGIETTECQLYRELTSGLSMPVGFRSGAAGGVATAVEACAFAKHHRTFIGVTNQGIPAVCHTAGNQDCHIILGGNSKEPDCNEERIQEAAKLLKEHGCEPRLLVDFSHGNSQKGYRGQISVCDEICRQLANGSKHIMGIMIESNLYEGNQLLKFPARSEDSSATNSKEPTRSFSGVGRSDSDILVRAFSMTQDGKVLSHLRYTKKVETECNLACRYGVSVTDKCMSWADTAEMLADLVVALQKRRLLYDKDSKKK